MPSARFTNAALARQTAERPVYLVTIDHAAFTTPIRICDGGADVTQGQGTENEITFEARAAKVIPPGDSADASARRGRISIDNTALDIIAKLRTATSQHTVKIEFILGDYPDDVEFSWPGLKITSQRPNGQTIELEVSEREDTGEILPYQKFTPSRFPALSD